MCELMEKYNKEAADKAVIEENTKNLSSIMQKLNIPLDKAMELLNIPLDKINLYSSLKVKHY